MRRRQRRLDDIKSEGGRAIAVKTNVLEKDSVDKARDLVIKEYGKIDILINGAVVPVDGGFSAFAGV